MPISLDQKESIDKWFKDKGVALKCTLCGSSSWKSDIVAALRATDAMNSGSIMATGPGMLRMLRMSCKECAYVVMFDAGRLGI